MLVGDVFLDTTLKNVAENGRVAVSVYDAKTFEGYQIQGKACYLTEGAAVDAFKAIALVNKNWTLDFSNPVQ